MKRQSILVFGLVALLVGSTAWFLYYRRDHQKLGNPGVKVVAQPTLDSRGKVINTNSVYLPATVLSYRSETPPVDDSVLNWLPKDTTYGQKLYQGADGLRFQMSVVMMGADRTSIHKPEYCLPAQGWTIEQTEYTSIPIAQPHAYSLPIVKIVARQEAQTPGGGRVVRHAVNVYWFVTENKLANRHDEWMKSMMRHLLLTGELERWAYVTCFGACLPGQEQALYERMKELIVAAVPQFQLVPGEPARLALKEQK